jgi:hypothetical protein
MDKIQTLVESAQFAMGILGNANTGDFALVDLGPAATEVQAALIIRGYRFVGVLAIVDGAPRSALNAPLGGGETIARLAHTFLAHFERVVTRVERDGESVMWLESLHELPDTRN